MLARGQNARRVSADERYFIHSSPVVSTDPQSYGGGDIYLIDLQEKRHLWTGLAYNDGAQVRIAPTGRVQSAPDDFDQYLTYVIRYPGGRIIPQTRIQFASRISLSPGHQLVQHALDIGGNITVTGQDLPLTASSLDDARDLPVVGDVTGIDLAGNRYLNDEGLEHLSELTSLEELNLRDTSATIKTLSQLPTLQRLRVLNISGLAISDKIIAYLPGNLEDLDVSHTEIGDFFASDLTHLNSLKRVVMIGTKVTPQGIARLKKVMPDCEIVTR